jgi:hypothetical protein
MTVLTLTLVTKKNILQILMLILFVGNGMGKVGCM